MLRQDDAQKAKLVEVGWLHGKEYGGHLASCAIMSILATRQRLGWGTWFEVCAAVPSKTAQLEQPIGIAQVWSPEYVRLLHEVEAIFDGSKNYAKDAIYWADLAKPITNQWFKDKVLGEPELHRIVGNMNSLTFFR